MSRTFKDDPAARRARRDRRFADREIPFDYEPSGVPVACWDGIADTAMTGVAPAGTTSEQRILRLLAAEPVDEPAIMVAAELTAYANVF